MLEVKAERWQGFSICFQPFSVHAEILDGEREFNKNMYKFPMVEFLCVMPDADTLTWLFLISLF